MATAWRMLVGMQYLRVTYADIYSILYENMAVVNTSTAFFLTALIKHFLSLCCIDTTH
jgi:hypothetical protein